MKKIVGILLLFIFIRSRIIVQSDLMGETLDDGDRVVENTHTYSCPSFPEDNGAKWIWGPNFNSVPDGEVRIFR